MRIKNSSKLALLATAVALLTAVSAQATLIHWSGAAGDRDWANGGNWDGGVVPGEADEALFDNTDGQTDFITNSAAFSTNNIISQSLTISNLTYSNWTYAASSPPYLSQHTEISDHQTLTVTNGLVVGVSAANGKGFTDVPETFAAISGLGGALAVTGGSVNVGYQSSESATVYIYALLDMYNLGNFSLNTTNGTFGVAAALHRRSGGEIFLAQTNQINSSNIWVGVGITGVAAHAGLLHLGQNNVFNCYNFTVGRDDEGELDFETNLTNPFLFVRGRDGISPVNSVYMGYTLSASSSWGHGTNNFVRGTFDLLTTNLFVAYHNGDVHGATQQTIDSLLLGTSTSNSIVARNVTVGSNPGGPTASETSKAVGLIDMQAGTFTASNVVVGSAVNAGTGNGTISVHGGTFTATNVSLGISATNGITYGILNLDGGSMRITGGVTVGANVNGTAGGEIDVTNATFGIGGQIGSTSNSLTRLVLSGGTLELGLGGGTNLAIYTTSLDVEAPTSIKITSQGLVVGQFPLIAYQNVTGSNGVAGLSVSLSAGVSAMLVDNSDNQTVDLMVTSVASQAAPPVLSSLSVLSANTYQLIGSGTANQPYSVYATTDLTALQWTLLGTTNADAGGVIRFVDQATNSQRFYRLAH